MYAITDKGSSIFGPAIVGAIIDRYGDIRPAFIFLAVLIFVPLPLMMLVNVERGKEESARMVRELGAQKESIPNPERDGILLIDEEADEQLEVVS